MKTWPLFLCLLVSAAQAAQETANPLAIASTNAAAAAAALKSPIVITSRTSEVNLRSNVVVYLGDVRVTEDTMSLTSDFLVASMPQKGGRIERILAETNVVLNMTDERGQKVHGRGERLLYSYRATETETNEVVELSGNPVIETDQGKTSADVITFDRMTGRVRFQNPHMQIEQEGSLTNLLSPTSLLPGRTNPPSRKP